MTRRIFDSRWLAPLTPAALEDARRRLLLGAFALRVDAAPPPDARHPDFLGRVIRIEEVVEGHVIAVVEIGLHLEDPTAGWPGFSFEPWRSDDEDDDEDDDGDFTQHEGAALPEDTVATLCDLARANDEPAFKDLARMVGVAVQDIDTLWTGTVRRVRRTMKNMENR